MARQVAMSMIQVTRTDLLLSEEEKLLEVAGHKAEDEKFEEEVDGEIEAENVAEDAAEVVAQVMARVVAEFVAQVVGQVVQLVDVVVDKAEVAEDMLAVDILSGMSLTLEMLLSLTFSPLLGLACTSLMASSQLVMRIFFKLFFSDEVLASLVTFTNQLSFFFWGGLTRRDEEKLENATALQLD